MDEISRESAGDLPTDPDLAGWAEILIVGDESAAPSPLAGLLRDAGYLNVWSTTDPSATLSLVAEVDPDLLCLDLPTLHRQGVRVIDDLRRRRPAETYLPIIVVAGQTTPDTRRQALAAGADHVLARPVDRPEFVLVARNLLEPRRVHRALETERAALVRLQSAALAAAADAIVITDRDGTIRWVNRAFTALTGYAPEEVLGRRPRLLRSGQHPPEYYEHLWRTIIGGAVWRGEVINRYKDGRLATEAMTITPVRGDGDAITHFIAIKQDVTAAREAERSRARLAAILEATPDFVATADPQGRVLYLNQAARRFLELPEDGDLSDVTITGSHPPWAADLVLGEGIPAAMRDGISHGETALLSRSGRLVPVSQTILAHRAADGQVEFLSTIAHDITERKQVEQALTDALIFNTSLVTAVSVGILTYRVTGECVSGNPTAAEMVGASEEVLRSQNFRTLASWKASGLFDLAERAITTRQPQASDLHILTTFGRDVWVRARCALFRAGDEELLLVVLADITERRQAEEALRDSEAHFYSAFEHAPFGMALVAPDGRWLRVNRALCAMLGYPEVDLLTQTVQDVTHPDDLETNLAFVRGMLSGDIQSYQMETRYIHRTGAIVWAASSVSLVRDDAGQPLQFVVQIQDITERRRIEDAARQQHALAVQNEKLAAMSTLLAGVARRASTTRWRWSSGARPCCAPGSTTRRWPGRPASSRRPRRNVRASSRTSWPWPASIPPSARPAP